MFRTAKRQKSGMPKKWLIYAPVLCFASIFNGLIRKKCKKMQKMGHFMFEMPQKFNF
jgi:hypothetical protein